MAIFRGSLVDASISNKRNNRTSLYKRFGQLKALHNSLQSKTYNGKVSSSDSLVTH